MLFSMGSPGEERVREDSLEEGKEGEVVSFTGYVQSIKKGDDGYIIGVKVKEKTVRVDVVSKEAFTLSEGSYIEGRGILMKINKKFRIIALTASQG